MNKFEITKRIEQYAPLDTQESWDASGWIVCTVNKDVKKVMLALTITDDIYNQAKLSECDMIISHHPLFCVPVKYSDIDMYCAHTNMDKASGGTTDALIKKIGWLPAETSHEFVRIVRFDKPIKLSELETRLRLISPNLRYTNNTNISEISSIGFCAGSGSEFI
ncbi:MAG: Nif3-like dinuclear metal center hexameric protein, partial [Candidatus Gastranaerophilales bacterium]|nr:Nif3-like dinuclear metal center hexameric protein [Candidatus Gastranaerophilales bacterium]